MALLLERKAVFLHIPKTGGSWVTRCAEEEGLVTGHLGSKHADLQRIEEFWRHYPYFYLRKIISTDWNLSSTLKSCFKFCFVRHPFDWMKSFYRFQTERNWPDWNGLGVELSRFGNSDWHPTSFLHSLPHGSFNEFLNSVIDLRPGFVHELYGWYTGSGIDFVGKQESLSVDFINALDKAGISADYKHIRERKPVNVSNKQSLDPDPDLVRKFHRVEYPTLLRYGYAVPSEFELA